MAKVDSLVLAIATLLLLVVDWLAFHDVREPHTLRDWLMLGASCLVFYHVGRTLWKGVRRTS